MTKIQNLLPAYIKAMGDDCEYVEIRTINIDGHEVTWMEFSGNAVGIDGKSHDYKGRELYCECHFAEGVGWKIMEDGTAVGLSGSEKCLYFETAVHLRHLELNREYGERFKDPFLGELDVGDKAVSEIILDLIEKAKAGEFLEGHSGADFYGGYFYLQTVASILGISMREVRRIIEIMVSDKKISLEGAVVQPYSKPPAPKWTEVFRVKKYGWTGIASRPTHSKMPQEWRFKVLKPKGNSVYKKRPPKLAFLHSTDFGVDIEDMSRAEKELSRLMGKAMKK